MSAEKSKIVFNSLPVDAPLRITSPFGKRDTGIAGASTFHQGIDLGRALNKPETNVLAVAAGSISQSYWNDFRGWVVVIDHNGFQTLSQHLKEKGQPAGTKVAAGQKIGVMGSSSNPAKLKIAEHLHFELRVAGTPIDPQPYLLDVGKEEEELTENQIRDIVKDEMTKTIAGLGISTDPASKPSAWADSFWKWGTENKIVDGTPQGVCTREQTTTMLYKLGQLLKINGSVK